MEDLEPIADLGNWSRRTILTGAGFSKNYGTKMVSEFMQALLMLPEVASNQALKRLLKNVGSFETALDSCSSLPEFRVLLPTLERAVLTIYEQMHHDFASRTGMPSVDPYQTSRFFRRFFGKSCMIDGEPAHQIDTGYIFTLNQDTCLEHMFQNIGDYQSRELEYPGDGFITREPDRSREPFSEGETTVYFNDDNGCPELRGKNNYIKLHGSFNWQTEDQRLMIVGGDKENRLNKMPLLRWYKRIFEAVLDETDALYILGYSFCDKHINDIIKDALKHNPDMRIFIHDVIPAPQLKENMISHSCKRIYDACTPVQAYLSNLMPMNEKVQDWERIQKAFFGY